LQLKISIYALLFQEFNLKQCGYYATRALRIEKFYAFWGQDLDSHVTPLECGRAFRTKLDKDIDFIGRKALEEQQKVKCLSIVQYIC
jgi:glycine cleavage system aminomethyltransferase T